MVNTPFFISPRQGQGFDKFLKPRGREHEGRTNQSFILSVKIEHLLVPRALLALERDPSPDCPPNHFRPDQSLDHWQPFPLFKMGLDFPTLGLKSFSLRGTLTCAI